MLIEFFENYKRVKMDIRCVVFSFFPFLLRKKSEFLILFSMSCTNNQSFPKLPLTIAQQEALCVLISCSLRAW